MEVTFGVGGLVAVAFLVIVVGVASYRLAMRRNATAERKRITSEWAEVRACRIEAENERREFRAEKQRQEQELDAWQDALDERDRELTHREASSLDVSVVAVT